MKTSLVIFVVMAMAALAQTKRRCQSRRRRQRQAPVRAERLLSVPRLLGTRRQRRRAPRPNSSAVRSVQCFRAQSAIRQHASVSREGDVGPGTRRRLRVHQEHPGTQARQRYSALELLALRRPPHRLHFKLDAFGQLFCSRFEVVLRPQVHLHLCRSAEVASQSHGSVGRDRAVPIKDFGQTVGGHAQCDGNGISAQARVFQDTPQVLSRMQQP